MGQRDERFELDGRGQKTNRGRGGKAYTEEEGTKGGAGGDKQKASKELEMEREKKERKKERKTTTCTTHVGVLTMWLAKMWEGGGRAIALGQATYILLLVAPVQPQL